MSNENGAYGRGYEAGLAGNTRCPFHILSEEFAEWWARQADGSNARESRDEGV